MEEPGQYLNILLNDNENLKNLLTAYLNTLISLKATYAKQENELQEQYQARLMQTVKPEERQLILNITTGFRAYATRIKISINTIKNKLPAETLAQLENDYHEIKTVPMPSYDSCESFAQSINDLLMNNMNVSSLVKKNL